jgi:hypothetical protein
MKTDQKQFNLGFTGSNLDDNVALKKYYLAPDIHPTASTVQASINQYYNSLIIDIVDSDLCLKPVFQFVFLCFKSDLLRL